MPIPTDDPLVNVPMITPFDSHDRVDRDAIARNVERWLERSVDSILVGSQSGEEDFLSEDEKLDMVRTVAQSAAGRCGVMAGIDCPSTTETLRRAEAFSEAGAEFLRIRFPRDAAVIVDYFEHVLARSPVPVLLMHQSSPQSFGIAPPPAAEPEVLGAVAAMDNVFGYVTDHDMRFESRVRRCVPADRRFWICNGSMMLLGAQIGCNGTTTAFANLWPDALKQLLKLGMAGRFDEGRELQAKIERIDSVMLPYRAVGIKTALNLMGWCGTRPRSPTRGMPAERVVELEAALRDAGLLKETDP